MRVEDVVRMIEEALESPEIGDDVKEILRRKLVGLKALIEVRRARRLTPEQVKEAQSVTCWGDLAGCCAPAKGCPYMLAACDALGLDPDEVFEAKSAAVRNLLRRKPRLPLHF